MPCKQKSADVPIFETRHICGSLSNLFFFAFPWDFCSLFPVNPPTVFLSRLGAPRTSEEQTAPKTKPWVTEAVELCRSMRLAAKLREWAPSRLEEGSGGKNEGFKRLVLRVFKGGLGLLFWGFGVWVLGDGLSLFFFSFCPVAWKKKKKKMDGFWWGVWVGLQMGGVGLGGEVEAQEIGGKTSYLKQPETTQMNG